MRSPLLRSLLLASLALALVNGCGRDRRSGGGRDDGPGTDGGSGLDSSTITAPPGELALAVESATWGGPASSPGRELLYVGVRLGNGDGGDPASLDPALFSARTGAGTEVIGAADVPFGEACSADLAVAGGANRACALVFRVPSAEVPTTIIYRSADGREASAPIVACSPSAPGGLCAAGSSCVDGSCVVLCSPESPDGACPAPGELCRAGTCVGECSPGNPTGACEEGSCVDGACDTACTQFDLAATGCLDCVTALSESGACGDITSTTCADAEGCAFCPFEGAGTSTCTCATQPACEGCEATARAAWDCIASECRSCVL